MKALALAAMLAGTAVAAHAADPVGVLKNVSGTVSVSGKGFMTRAAEGTPITSGSSVLVASNGKATLVLNSGCSIPLAASQHVVVDAKLPCEQIQASVKQLFPAYRVAQAGIGQGLPGAAGGGAGAGATGGAGPAGAGAAGAGAAGGAGAAAAGAAGAGAAGAAAAGAAAGGALSGLGGVFAGLGVAGTAGVAVATVAVVSAVNTGNSPE